MKIKRVIVLFLIALIGSACTTKDYSPSDFKKYSAKQILAGGEKVMAKGNYSDAIKYFEAVDALYPFDPEVEQSQLRAIYAYYKAEDFASAIAAANRYIQLYPEGKHTDYAYYVKGLANFDKDKTFLQKFHPVHPEKLDVTNLKDAFSSFNELVKNFPHSAYAKDAKQRMVYIRDLLAKHELDIAQFYFKRKAYVAAANRANYVVKYFDETREVKEALKIMIKSYRALNLDKQARDAARVFNLNFPQEKI